MMSTLLFIEANDTVNQPESVSSMLNETFLESYRKNHPEDRIVSLNLFEERLPFFDLKLAASASKMFKGVQLTPEEELGANQVHQYLDGFLEADKVVFSFPMWNLTVPAPLHNYMDYLAQAGRTFRYTPEGSVGLVEGKKVMLIHSRGGNYSEGEKKQTDHALRYMIDLLHFFGVTDVETIVLEGHQQFPEEADRLIENAVSACETAGKVF